ncbi:MAG: hypothetical protein O2985_13285 [Proteobacteria bacterium]|nr:hypothetical protein [Pseudomonadota bacterium]
MRHRRKLSQARKLLAQDHWTPEQRQKLKAVEKLMELAVKAGNKARTLPESLPSRR